MGNVSIAHQLLSSQQSWKTYCPPEEQSLPGQVFKVDPDQSPGVVIPLLGIGVDDRWALWEAHSLWGVCLSGE